MKHTRSIAQNGNLYPADFDIVSALPPQMLRQDEHDGVRHPLATYNLSIGQVLKGFCGVLNALEQLDAVVLSETATPEIDPTQLLVAQKELLDALSSHLDDGYLILRAVYPDVKLKREKDVAEQWLEAAKHGTVMRLYKDAISSYRRSFIRIVNDVKHNTGRLRVFVMYDEKQRIPGYYLETEASGGVVGPDLRMHPGNTAFSFNRDLRYHFCNLYSVGEALKQALLRAAKTDYGITFLSAPVSAENALLEEVAERISNLRFWFYPDEAAKVTPVVLFTREGDNRRVTVEETRSQVPFVMRNFVGHSIMQGDGVTRSWRVPYMQYTAR